MANEELQEFAGHLKAELLSARHEFDHGRIAQSEFMARLAIIQRRRVTALAHHTATVYHSDAPQVTLF